MATATAIPDLHFPSTIYFDVPYDEIEDPSKINRLYKFIAGKLVEQPSLKFVVVNVLEPNDKTQKFLEMQGFERVEHSTYVYIVNPLDWKAFSTKLLVITESNFDKFRDLLPSVEALCPSKKVYALRKNQELFILTNEKFWPVVRALGEPKDKKEYVVKDLCSLAGMGSDERLFNKIKKIACERGFDRITLMYTDESQQDMYRSRFMKDRVIAAGRNFLTMNLHCDGSDAVMEEDSRHISYMLEREEIGTLQLTEKVREACDCFANAMYLAPVLQVLVQVFISIYFTVLNTPEGGLIFQVVSPFYGMHDMNKKGWYKNIKASVDALRLPSSSLSEYNEDMPITWEIDARDVKRLFGEARSVNPDDVLRAFLEPFVLTTLYKKEARELDVQTGCFDARTTSPGRSFAYTLTKTSKKLERGRRVRFTRERFLESEGGMADEEEVGVDLAYL